MQSVVTLNAVVIIFRNDLKSDLKKFVGSVLNVPIELKLV
jgi:hypothetical protein